MLKSWNEWGEGNYIEPDTEFGHGYLEALRDGMSEFYNKKLQCFSFSILYSQLKVFRNEI